MKQTWFENGINGPMHESDRVWQFNGTPSRKERENVFITLQNVWLRISQLSSEKFENVSQMWRRQML
jgi:hypothetical protein